MEGTDVQPHEFLTSALDGGKGQPDTSSLLLTGKAPTVPTKWEAEGISVQVCTFC
jgi:hypothetical protein